MSEGQACIGGAETAPGVRAAPEVLTGSLDPCAVLPLTLPRQHDAWSVLLLGFALGAAVGGAVGTPTLLMLGAVVCGFVARHAAGVWARLSPADRRRGHVAGWAAAYLAASALLSVALVLWYERWLVIAFGLLAAAFGAASLALERRRQDCTLTGELIGMLGLSLAVPAAAYAATGAFHARTVGLWAVSALFFTGGVFHVRCVARNRRERDRALLVYCT